MGKDRSDFKLALAGSVGLILAIATVVLTQPPLQSSRPAGESTKQTVRENMVSARLWEDPLEAVERAKDKNLKGKNLKYQPEGFAPVRNKIIEKNPTEQSPIDILIVTTAGGPYAEDKETRVRDRYAIASALGVACYVPEEEEHLLYVKRTIAGKEHRIPYEWYRARKTRDCFDGKGHAQAVLVLWITSEILQKPPLDSLEHLIGSLLCVADANGERCEHPLAGKKAHIRVKVIGPRSSSEFRDWLEEVYSNKKPKLDWPTDGKKIELYSPWATAMPKLLSMNGDSKKEASSCNSPQKCFQGLVARLKEENIELKSSIGSDDQLATALVEELERRKVEFGKDAIVLLGEWDSFYGRALPIEFRAAVCSRIASRIKTASEKYSYIAVDKQREIKEKCGTLDDAINLQITNQKSYDNLELNVLRYSYLRGLDGQVPREKQDKSSSKNERDNGESKKEHPLDVQFLERPVGPSQLDYTRRLVDRIARETAERKSKVRAVGILGSDAYDALLILQALRDRFPTAAFFVTDLDARLAYPEEYRWTRNLIIASHFGLELHEKLQHDIPPFRSGYQTSAFLATLQAVGHVQGLFPCPPPSTEGRPRIQERNETGRPCGYGENLTDKMFDATEAPRLYEVGRHGAVDLSVGAPQSGYASLHPRRLDLEAGSTKGLKPDPKRVGAWLALCLLATAATLWVYHGTRQWIEKISFKWWVIIVSLFVLAYLLGIEWIGKKTDSLVKELVSNHDAGEPFYWFEGVSIWPAEIIRLVAALLAVGLFAKALFDLSLNRKEVEQHFQFDLSPKKKSIRERFRESWFTTSGWNRRKEAWLMVLGSPNRETREKVGVSWNLYVEAGSLTHLFIRVLVLFCAIRFFVSEVVWLVIDNPDWWTPCRGEFSCRWDREIIIGLAIPAATFLSAFALDTAMLCHRWIGMLSSSTGGWPHPGTEQEHQLNKVRLVAKRTEAISKIIKYPPLILLLLIVGRNNYFDQWNFPTELIAAWTINFLLAVAPEFLLYRTGEKMRNGALDHLNRNLHRQLKNGDSAASEVDQTREAIKDIENIRKGVFLPLWHQPLVQTFFYGVVALLQYLYLGVQ